MSVLLAMEKIRYLNELREKLNQERTVPQGEEAENDLEREFNLARTSQLDWLEIAAGKMGTVLNSLATTTRLTLFRTRFSIVYFSKLFALSF